jgi:polar amino acid transport system substrate-binding protein
MAVLLAIAAIIRFYQLSAAPDFKKSAPESSAKPLSLGTVTPDNGILLVTGEWEPLTSEKLPDRGFFTNIVSSVFSEMKTDYSIRFYPWARCELLVSNGDAFAAFPYTKTEDRAKKFLFTRDIYKVATKLFFYKKSKNNFSFNNLTDLKSYKIGAVGGYFYVEWFQKNNIPFDQSDTELQALQKLIDGKIDLLPLTEINGWDLIKKQYPDQAANFGTLDKTMDENKVSLLVSKNYPDAENLIALFNASFQKILDNGTYTKILRDSNKTEGSILQ